MVRLGLLGVASALVISGCATATGPAYSEYKSGIAAVPMEQARLTVFRQSEGLAGAARSARLKLDGLKVGTCDVQGFMSLDAAPGQHVLSVDLPDTPGTCELPVSIQAGNEYFYEVRVRSDAITSAILLGVVGQAIESSGKQCGGAFSIESVDKPYADSILPTMRLTQ